MGFINIVRSILVFIWILPFLYLLFEKFSIGNIALSYLQLKLLFFASFVSSFALFLEWLLAFRSILYFNKAFNNLRKNDIYKLNNILSKIQINKCYENGKTLLQYAVDNQMDNDVISFLLSRGGLVTYKSDQEYNISYTLFYLASYYDYIDEKSVQYFLNKGAYLDFVDNSRGFNSLSLLQVLVLRCHERLVDLLLSKGADIDYMVPDLDMNTLMLAAKYINNTTIIEKLIKAGSNIEKTNSNGYNALLFAAEFNPNSQIIYTLVENGATIEPYKIRGTILRINNVTPLRLAVISNNIEVVNALIELGDDVNYKDIYGLSILFIAAAHNHDVKIIELLLDSGASLKNAIDNEGNTPLMGAAYLNSNPNVINFLIKNNNNLGRRNQEGFSFIDYLKENTALSEEDKQSILNRFF
ncbi:ankyrin repeat domain-containing protein [Rickettsiales bacterium LUAb2]